MFVPEASPRKKLASETIILGIACTPRNSETPIFQSTMSKQALKDTPSKMSIFLRSSKKGNKKGY
jgi:hypothetical protein